MNIRKKKEYAVPQMETLELAYEKQVLLEDSEHFFDKDGEEPDETDGELG